MASYKKGEIYWADLGEIGTDEVWGHEQGGNRPVVIIKDLSGAMLFVVPLTSSQNRIDYQDRTKVLVFPDNDNCLTKNSTALCAHFKSISDKRLGGKIGDLDELTFNSICNSLIDMIQGN